MKQKVSYSFKNHTQPNGQINKKIALLNDRPMFVKKEIEQRRKESPEDRMDIDSLALATSTPIMG